MPGPTRVSSSQGNRAEPGNLAHLSLGNQVPLRGNQAAREQLRQVYLSELGRAWSLEELQELRGLLSGPSYRLFHKALALAMAQVDEEIYRREATTTWERFNYLRGRAQLLQELMRLPEQVELDIERLRSEADGQ